MNLDYQSPRQKSSTSRRLANAMGVLGVAELVPCLFVVLNRVSDHLDPLPPLNEGLWLLLLVVAIAIVYLLASQLLIKRGTLGVVSRWTAIAAASLTTMVSVGILVYIAIATFRTNPIGLLMPIPLLLLASFVTGALAGLYCVGNLWKLPATRAASDN